MNSRPELVPVEANPGLPEKAQHTVRDLLDRLQQHAAETLRLNAALAARDATLKHAEAKIQALTLELAHLRRIRFGAKSEALNAEQRDLFQRNSGSRHRRLRSRSRTGRPATPRQTRTSRSSAAA